VSTALETTTAIQDKLYAGMLVGQKAVIDSVKTWADIVETVYAKFPDLMTAEPMKPSQLMETTLGFTEKVVSSQKDFVAKLVEAAMPVTRMATSAAAKASSAATPK
jgi:hypothetical protein